MVGVDDVELQTFIGEQRAFQRDIIDRLARIEENTKTANLGRDERIKNIEKDIADFKEEKKWLWRTIVGAWIVSTVGLLFKLFGGKL